MAQIVELPNGDSVEFPDGMSADDMSAAIATAFPKLVGTPAAVPGPRSSAVTEDEAMSMDLPTTRSRSVMDNLPADAGRGGSLIEERGAPVSPEYFTEVKRRYDLATPEQRAAMAKTGGPTGAAVRAIDKTYAEQDKQVEGLTSAPHMGGRVEDRTKVRLRQDYGPDAAKAEAIEDVRTGTAPGPASLAESTLDFEAKNATGVQHLWQDFESGVVGSTGATLSYLGRKAGDRDIEAVGASMSNWAEGKMPANPTFVDKLVNGIGSSGSFLIPGLGVAKGAEALAIISRTAAKWTGAGTMAALEAAAEADGVYRQLIASGASEERAAREADGAFWANMALLGVTDKVAFFTDMKAAKTTLGQFVKHAAPAAPVEGVQEMGQQVVSNVATDRPTGEGVIEAGAIGAIVGGVSGGVKGIVAPSAPRPVDVLQARTMDEAVATFNAATDADVSVDPELNTVITALGDLARVGQTSAPSVNELNAQRIAAEEAAGRGSDLSIATQQEALAQQNAVDKTIATTLSDEEMGFGINQPPADTANLPDLSQPVAGSRSAMEQVRNVFANNEQDTPRGKTIIKLASDRYGVDAVEQQRVRAQASFSLTQDEHRAADRAATSPIKITANPRGTYDVTVESTEQAAAVTQALAAAGVPMTKTPGDSIRISRNADRAVAEQIIARVNTQFSQPRTADMIVEQEATLGQTTPTEGEMSGAQAPQTQQTQVPPVQAAAQPRTAVQNYLHGSLKLSEGATVDEVEPDSAQVNAIGKPLVTRLEAKVARLIGSLFGTKVRFYKASERTGDGFYRGGDTLWLNVDTGIHPLSVFGHEWTHSLETSDEDSHKALQAAVTTMMTPERALAFSQYYDESNNYGWRDANGKLKTDVNMAQIVSEASADIGGNLAHDSTFYQEVFDEVARQHPQDKARTIIQKIATSLINAINKLLASVGRNAYKQQFQTSDRLGLTREELLKARDIIRSAAAKAIAKENEARAKGKPFAIDTQNMGPFSGIDTVQETPPRLSDEAKKLWAERGENAEDRQYDLGIAKGQRAKKQVATLSGDEKLRIARDAKKYGFRVEDVEAEVRSIKLNYPASEGWAQPVFNQIAEKGENLNSRIEFKTIPYTFNLPQNWAGSAPNPNSTKATPWVADMANRVTQEIVELTHRAAAGDKVAKTIIDHMTWYREMARRLRDEFGGFGDAFADLLGATSPNTPVRINWNFSIDLLRRFVRGDFDAKLKAYEEAVMKGIGPVEFRKTQSTELITQLTGAQYGINSVNAAKALVGLWRAVKQGDAPKARNFALNLIGQSDKATIDVRAARMLQRLAKRLRIPPKAEGAVSGNHAAKVENVTGQFGFGQLVLDKAATQLREQGVDITAPDLQAIAWFLEKEIWTKNGWTRGLGSEGSFEQEADKMPVDRYQAGATIAQYDSVPTDAEMAEARDDMTDVLKGDEGVIAYRALPTVGMYAGATERSFDQEVLANRGWNPGKWIAGIVRKMQAANQYDAFFSRVLQPNEESANARPGMEIYFKSAEELAKVQPMLDAIVAKGIDGFTLVVDPLQRRSLQDGSEASTFIGVRLQYVPEIALRWMDKASDEYRKLTSGDVKQVQEVLDDKEDRIADAVLEMQKNGAVAFAKGYHYDTLVVGKENYGDYTDPESGKANSAFGEDRSGQPIAGRLEEAARRLSAEAGREPAGDVLQRASDGESGTAGETRKSERRAPDEGRDGQPRERAQGQGRPSYGEGIEGSISVTGVHYSTESREQLDGAFYGRGLKGAERPRVMAAKDARLRQRVYFYINTGNGTPAEAGVGAVAHTVDLRNLYDMDADTRGLMPEGLMNDNDRMNGFETNVIDAGYDGYLTRNFGNRGAAVLIGKHLVPVVQEANPDVSAAGKMSLSGWKDQQQKVMENRALPGGQMTGANWKRLMAAVMPEVDVSHLEDGKDYYKDQIVKAGGMAFSSTDANIQHSAPRIKPLNAEEQAVADRFFDRIDRQAETLISMYLSRNGTLIDPDLVKELSPDYAVNPGKWTNAVHEPSSKLSKMIYARMLEDVEPGEAVVFTAGGGGSGKSESLDWFKRNLGGTPAIIFDSTLSSFDSAKKKIDAALEKAAQVTVLYTNRPADGAFDFSLNRKRAVPIPVIASAHSGAQETLHRLADHYGDRVPFEVRNNYGERIDEMFSGSLRDVPQERYDALERRFYDIAKRRLDEGTISQDRFEAVAHRPEHEGRQGSRGALGEEQEQDLGRDRQGELAQGELRLSTQRLSDDLEGQYLFLVKQAEDAGYVGIDDWAANDIGAYVKAAETWRNEHQVADALFSTARDQSLQWIADHKEMPSLPGKAQQQEADARFRSLVQTFDRERTRIADEGGDARDLLNVMLPATPAPAVLRLIGAPNQWVAWKGSIVTKVLSKHAQNPETLNERLRDPALIFRTKNGELEVITDLYDSGDPVMLVLKPDVTEQFAASRGGNKSVKLTAVMSAYPISWQDKTVDRELKIGLEKRLMQPQNRELVYANDSKAFALFRGVAAKSARTLVEQRLQDRKVLSENDLVKLVGDHFRDGMPGRDWNDVAFSTPRSQLTGAPIGQLWQDTTQLGEWDAFVRKMQDKLIDTKRIVAEIRKAGVAIKDQFDPYLQEVLYHGRAAKHVSDFMEKELTPLLVDMHVRGIEMQELEDYLWAKHAAERNAQIAAVNPGMPDGGSGLTDQEAADILAGKVVTKNGREIQLQVGRMAAYQTLAGRVKQITNNTLDLLVSSGLESQDTINAWQATYANYVPLMRDMEADDNYAGAFNLGNGTGAGFSVRGSASKRAMGSERSVIDILANVAMQRERAIIRAEKNNVAMAVYGLAISAPNPDFWLPINPDAKDQTAVMAELVRMGVNPIDAQNIAMEPKQRYVAQNGMVAERINPAIRSRQDILSVRVNGRDRHVMFSSDERAQEMVRNLKNLENEQLGVILQNTALITRWFASINTQYNPIFGLTNGIRDFSTGMLNLSSTSLKGHRLEVAKNAMSALTGIYIDLRDHRKGIVPTSAWAQEFEEFQRAGGQTGYRDMFQTSKQRAEAIAEELKNAGKGNSWLALGQKSHIFGWLSDYNTAIENAMRLSAYHVAKQNGMSNDQAASLAKNLTVNFNKKGLAATQTGALYAFFNAAVQGTARIGETVLRRDSGTGKTTLTAAGQKIVYGGMLLGVMQAVMFAVAGYDDDEPAQFLREKNFIIPLPGGKYFSIPYPLGYHVLPGIGRVAAEFALSGFKKPGKRMTDLFSMIVDGFNPIGSSGGSVIQMLSPTVTDPIVALSENRDWTGKSIYREDFDKMHPTAGWTRKKDTASDVSKALSYFINYATGGGKYEIGMLSPTPDQIDYLIGQATGGVGRESLKLWQAGKTPITGETLPLYKVPGVGRFVGETTGQTSEMSKFYSNLKRIGEHKSALDEMKDAHDGDARLKYLAKNPDARLVQLANTAAYEVRKIQKQKRVAMEAGNKERVKLAEQRLTETVRRYNDRLSEKE